MQKLSRRRFLGSDELRSLGSGVQQSSSSCSESDNNNNGENMEETKQCATCKKNLPRAEFYSNRSKPDGLTTTCKKCTMDYQRAYREARNEAPKRRYVRHAPLMTSLKIDKHVPLPMRYQVQQVGHIAEEMVVGDSVAFQNINAAKSFARVLQSKRGRKAATGQRGNIFRVWRVA